jgi:hypothetical protein
VVKASRRAIFRGVFSTSPGFELDHDTANEILMRINQSLDPIPLTEGMWASFLAMRRELRYAEYDWSRASRTDAGTPAVEDLAAAISVDHLAPHVAKDLVFLLRIEARLRTSVGSSAGSAQGDDTSGNWSCAARDIAREIRGYLGQEDIEGTEALQRGVIDPLVQYLGRAAGILSSSNTTNGTD